MRVSACVVALVFYSVAGWVYESTYCTIVERKWANRGFLYGPVCPIYGVGVLAMMLAWGAVSATGFVPKAWQVFLVSAAGSAVLEYLTSWVLEKLFHARWWDYANMPFNLNGRICLPASVLFGLGGLLVAYVLYQPTVDAVSAMPTPLVETLALVLVAIISADTALTVSALTQFAQAAASINNAANDRMERFVDATIGRSDELIANVAQERERIAAQARAMRISEMRNTVASAVRRIYSFPPSEDQPSLARQLEALWRELRKR